MVPGGGRILPESIRVSVTTSGSQFGILGNEANNYEALINNNSDSVNLGKKLASQSMTVDMVGRSVSHGETCGRKKKSHSSATCGSQRQEPKLHQGPT